MYTVQKWEFNWIPVEHLEVKAFIMGFSPIETKAQGTSGRTGYFFAGYGYFPHPNVTGLVYKDPNVRKFNFYWKQILIQLLHCCVLHVLSITMPFSLLKSESCTAPYSNFQFTVTLFKSSFFSISTLSYSLRKDQWPFPTAALPLYDLNNSQLYCHLKGENLCFIICNKKKFLQACWNWNQMRI